MKRILLVLVPLLLAVSTGAHAADHMRFWNLTGTTIKELHLAPVGTTTWGPNQCANDKDGSVDPDERLALVGVAPGHYDVKLTDVKGRTCLAKDVTVQGSGAYAFSISESELKDCSQ